MCDSTVAEALNQLVSIMPMYTQQIDRGYGVKVAAVFRDAKEYAPDED